MSCDKHNCHKKSNLPREEIALDIGAVAQAFTQMLQVAKTGIDNFAWTSAELAHLAQMIVALVRKPDPAEPPDVSASRDQLTLRFGPQNAYALHMPAGSEKQRNALIAQLVTATATLAAPSKMSMQNLNQLSLPFSE